MLLSGDFLCWERKAKVDFSSYMLLKDSVSPKTVQCLDKCAPVAGRRSSMMKQRLSYRTASGGDMRSIFAKQCKFLLTVQSIFCEQ